MNKDIKKMAIKHGICDAQAINDPEAYDGYKTYDKLTKFIEDVKQYYIQRERNQQAKK